MKRIVSGLLAVAALGAATLALPATASAQVYVGISVGYAPPPIPVYAQPACPGAGYLWTPGYWAWGPYGYYWVPGTWVLAPAVGLLWTPGYWAWNAGAFWWQPGYWGPTVGYYGDIDYGYGYPGIGYGGGYWGGGNFYYNLAVTNVNVTYIKYVYTAYPPTSMVQDQPADRVSYFGGRGGTRLQPTVEQLRYAREHHRGATEWQWREQRLAMNDPQQRFEVNRGQPRVTATPLPGAFGDAGAMQARRERTDARNGTLERLRMSAGWNMQRVVRGPQLTQRADANVAHSIPIVRSYSEGQRVERGFRPEPAQVYRPPVRVDAPAWHEARSAMPRPEQFRAPMAPAFHRDLHFAAHAPARGGGRPGGGRPGGGRPRGQTR